MITPREFPLFNKIMKERSRGCGIEHNILPKEDHFCTLIVILLFFIECLSWMMSLFSFFFSNFCVSKHDEHMFSLFHNNFHCFGQNEYIKLTSVLRSSDFNIYIYINYKYQINKLNFFKKIPSILRNFVPLTSMTMNFEDSTCIVS